VDENNLAIAPGSAPRVSPSVIIWLSVTDCVCSLFRRQCIPRESLPWRHRLRFHGDVFCFISPRQGARSYCYLPNRHRPCCYTAVLTSRITDLARPSFCLVPAFNVNTQRRRKNKIDVDVSRTWITDVPLLIRLKFKVQSWRTPKTSRIGRMSRMFIHGWRIARWPAYRPVLFQLWFFSYSYS